jgi:hypothetical protein
MKIGRWRNVLLLVEWVHLKFEILFMLLVSDVVLTCSWNIGKRLGGSLSAAEAGRSGRLSYHAAESSRTLGSSSQISRENGGSGHITESSPLLLNSSHLKRDTSSVSDGRHLVRASNSMHLSDGRSITNCCRCVVWWQKYTKHLM